MTYTSRPSRLTGPRSAWLKTSGPMADTTYPRLSAAIDAASLVRTAALRTPSARRRCWPGPRLARLVSSPPSSAPTCRARTGPTGGIRISALHPSRVESSLRRWARLDRPVPVAHPDPTPVTDPLAALTSWWPRAGPYWLTTCRLAVFDADWSPGVRVRGVVSAQNGNLARPWR